MADVALLREAQGHLEEALARAGNDRVRRRILWLKNGFDFTMAIADAFEARKAAGSSEEKIERLFAAAKAVEAAHGRLIKDPAYKHTYYLPGRRFESRCWDDWFKDPMRLAAEAYWKDLHASLPETQAASQWESFKRRSGLGPFLDKRGWELAFDIGRNSKE